MPRHHLKLALRIMMTAIWGVSAVSILTLKNIQDHAFGQPQTATGIYTHPHTFQTNVHFLTDGQNRILAIAGTAFFISMSTLLGIACVERYLAERAERRTKSK
jgi:hypothetical protein